ncbi:MAG: DnaJ domain-containing protein [Alphaproteobacteria bacterium]
MSEKPDYYQVLGVDKKASKADIKSAYQKIAMKNHPDMVKNKPWPQAQKDEAIAKFKIATEAEGVLTDDTKRAVYDQNGHRGLENLAAGKSAGSGQSYTEAAGGRMKRGPFTEEDTFSFFEKRAERSGSTATQDDGLTPEQRRAKAREERLARRNRDDSTTPSVKEPFDAASSSNVFKDVTEKVADAADALKNGVTLPFDVLEKFRDNLQDFVREVDKAIARSRPPGPKRS